MAEQGRELVGDGPADALIAAANDAFANGFQAAFLTAAAIGFVTAVVFMAKYPRDAESLTKAKK